MGAARKTKDAKQRWQISNYSARLHIFTRKTKGKREYSSPATRRKGHAPRTGPLKSRLRRSHGRKAFIRVWTGGLKKRGFISAHVRHNRQTVFSPRWSKADYVVVQSGKVERNQDGRVIHAIGKESYKVRGHTNEITHPVQRYRHRVYGGCHNAVDSVPNATIEF